MNWRCSSLNVGNKVVSFVLREAVCLAPAAARSYGSAQFRLGARRLQFLSRLAIALVLTLGVATAARAENAASLRQELDALNSKIEQIDADITGTAQGNTEIKGESDAYAADTKANTATGDELKQRGQQLATRREQLDNEHAAAEQLCRKTTATPQEYEAALAQCEKARQAYQQHADAYRADEQHLADDLAAYQSAAQKLQAEYKEIERKRQDLLARQASLQDKRQRALNQFNELRDRLVALQPGPK
jgi:chromosome segregation ATPase